MNNFNEKTWTTDRANTRSLVLKSLLEYGVPQELITEYFDLYDKETEVGIKIAQHMDIKDAEDAKRKEPKKPVKFNVD